MVSIIVPIFNEEKTISELHKRIVEVMGKLSYQYEIIFINDDSTDRTEEIAKDLKPLKFISLLKNYGQTPTLNIGIQEAAGDVIILLDADLQNRPEDIPLLLKKITDGCDVVVGWRQQRKDKLSRILFSRYANSIARLLLGLKVHDFGCGLKAYRSKFIKNFHLWGQIQVFLPAIARARGAKICEVPVFHEVRKAGISKIKIFSMIRGGFGLLQIAFISRFWKSYKDEGPAPYVIKSIKENL